MEVASRDQRQELTQRDSDNKAMRELAIYKDRKAKRAQLDLTYNKQRQLFE